MAKHIYVHVPFCEAKCLYCSFFSCVNATAAEDFFAATHKELDALEIREDNNPDSIDTVYFGGGTPSSVDAGLVCDLLKSILNKFEINPNDSEITIEVNPHSLTMDKALAYREAGFNRVSMGVQSLTDSVLKTLGRLHDSSLAKNAIKILKGAGFTKISCDLMLGIPGQTLENLLSDAKYLVDQGVTHISMYSLSIEEGTPFEKLYPHLEEVVDEDLERAMYHGLRDFLSESGIQPYEISNCGAPGYESIHNTAYWEGMEYYSIGAGSHGYLDGIRFCHVDSIEAYISNPICTEVEEELSDEAKMREYAMLRLRMTKGINRMEMTTRFGVNLDSVYGDSIKKYVADGYLVDDGKNVFLSSKGLDYANLVFEEFM